MSNTRSAAATGLPGLSRRAFARSAAGVLRVEEDAFRLTSFRSTAETAASDELVMSLWHKRHEARAATLAMEGPYLEAEARLPWWAAPGPERLTADGVFNGFFSIWPAIIPTRLPSTGGFNIRPNRWDIEEWYERAYHDLQGRKNEAALKAALDRLEDRRAAQKDAENRVGVTAVRAQVEKRLHEFHDVGDMIRRVGKSSGPAAFAAHILIDLSFESDNNEFKYQWQFPYLRELLCAALPLLSGRLARDVRSVLKNPGRPASLLDFSRPRGWRDYKRPERPVPDEIAALVVARSVERRVA